jgi:hypothetical protein
VKKEKREKGVHALHAARPARALNYGSLRALRKNTTCVFIVLAFQLTGR